MTTLYIGLADTDEAVLELVDKMSKQPEDEVLWRLFQFDPTVRHTLPLTGSEVNGAGHITSIDPAGETLAQRLARRFRIHHDYAQQLAAGLHRGSIVVTVEATETAVASVRRLLRAVGVRIVTTQAVSGRLAPSTS